MESTVSAIPPQRQLLSNRLKRRTGFGMLLCALASVHVVREFAFDPSLEVLEDSSSQRNETIRPNDNSVGAGSEETGKSNSVDLPATIAVEENHSEALDDAANVDLKESDKESNETVQPHDSRVAESEETDKGNAVDLAVSFVVEENHTQALDDAANVEMKESDNEDDDDDGALLPDPNNHPLIQWKKGSLSLSKLPRMPVVVWPFGDLGPTSAEYQHIEENGLAESKYLTLSSDTYTMDPNSIWVGDTGFPRPMDVWCGEYLKKVREAKKRRKALGLPLQWPIFLLDFTDFFSLNKCEDIETEMGTEWVSYSTRAIVQGREWNESKAWVEPGQVASLQHENKTFRHTPLVVRTDTIDTLAHTLHEQHNLSIHDEIENIERPVDVTHLWPLDNTGVGTVASNLRLAVSHIVADVGNSSDLKVLVGLAGDAAKTGRRGVKTTYIEALLRTKIVIVTQRDRWEDHYRLFEGLVSGAMVMTDRMLSLPRGLRNGISIIEFESEDELRTKIEYYVRNSFERLAIAAQGRRIAMMRHRSWHRMEEIIFGQAVSNCTQSSACPYIVNTDEGR